MNLTKNIDALPPSINCIWKQTQEIPCCWYNLVSPIWKTALGMSWGIGLNEVTCDLLEGTLVSSDIMNDNGVF